MTKAILKSNAINTSDVRASIENTIRGITPLDSIESQHIAETLQWINSGEQLFRVQKPDIPAKHLVSYFVLLDQVQQKILLVDHKKACLWLPSGGHVEIDELPHVTVQRECEEELGIKANFYCSEPIFLTSTITVGLTAGHTDVSLWYVLNGDADAPLIFDKEEFNSVKWFDFIDIPFEQSDPYMQRFMQKLKSHKDFYE